MIRRLAAGALVAGTALLCLTAGTLAHSIEASPAEAAAPSFDIVETSIVTKGDVAVCRAVTNQAIGAPS